MFKCILRIDEKEVKRFISLTSNQNDYIDGVIDGDKFKFVCYDRELSVFYTVPYTFRGVPKGKVEFRIKKSVLNQLVVDGYMIIEFSDKLKITFTPNLEIKGITIETDLQIVNSEDYTDWFSLDLDGYEEIKLEQLSELCKIANMLRTYVSVDDNVAYIEYDRTYFYQPIELCKISLKGNALKRLLLCDRTYNYGNYVVGILGDIMVVCNKLKASNFDDYQFIKSRENSYITSTKVSLTALAELTKKCRFSNGECCLDLNEGICSYTQEGITYSVGIVSSHKSMNKISIPNWIIKNILSVYPSLLSDIEIRIFNSQVMIKSRKFTFLYRLKRM